MLTEQTVLILGAGASYPYGFPIGTELKRRILALTDPDDWSEFAEHAFRTGLARSTAEIKNFHENFKASSLYSIDRYLGIISSDPKRENFVNIGKQAIAWTIAECEVWDRLNDPDNDQGPFYEYLWNHLVENILDGTQGLLSIVTFNYDRSLQAFLLDRIIHTLGWPRRKAVEQLRKIKIHHVYGSLGSAFEIDEDYLHYGREHHFSDTYATIATRIRVIGERAVDADQAILRTELSRSKRIATLGFGFDEKNMESLGLSDPSKNGGTVVTAGVPQIGLCTLGLRSGEVHAAKRWFGSQAKTSHTDCLDSLRHFGTFLPR